MSARLLTALLLASVIVMAGCDPFERDTGRDPSLTCDERCVISGYVLDEEGNPMEGVKIARSGAGVGYVFTDRRGHYTMRNNVMWWNYCLTPSKGPWVFEPTQRCYHKIDRNYADGNFVAVRVESLDISGYVIDQGGFPLEGVVITLQDSEENSARTNRQGYYIVQNIASRQDYCLVPYKTGYTFDPEEHCYKDLKESQYSQNFIAARSH